MLTVGQRHHCHHNKRKSTNSSFWRSTAFRLKKLVLQMRKSSSTRRRTRLPAWYLTTFRFPYLMITVIRIKRSARDLPNTKIIIVIIIMIMIPRWQRSAKGGPPQLSRLCCWILSRTRPEEEKCGNDGVRIRGIFETNQKEMSQKMSLLWKVRPDYRRKKETKDKVDSRPR